MASFGVDFFALPFMNHAKVMLIDGEEGVIGSQNMDILSFNLNMEAGVFFRQKQLISDLSRIVEHWKNQAEHLNITGFNIKWTDRILIGIFKFFYPIF